MSRWLLAPRSALRQLRLNMCSSLLARIKNPGVAVVLWSMDSSRIIARASHYVRLTRRARVDAACGTPFAQWTAIKFTSVPNAWTTTMAHTYALPALRRNLVPLGVVKARRAKARRENRNGDYPLRMVLSILLKCTLQADRAVPIGMLWILCRPLIHPSMTQALAMAQVLLRFQFWPLAQVLIQALRTLLVHLPLQLLHRLHWLQYMGIRPPRILLRGPPGTTSGMMMTR